MKNCLTRSPSCLTHKKCATPLVTLLKMRPHYSQSSRENATPSGGTSPLASYKEVTPPPPPQPPGGVHILRNTWSSPLSQLVDNDGDNSADDQSLDPPPPHPNLKFPHPSLPCPVMLRTCDYGSLLRRGSRPPYPNKNSNTSKNRKRAEEPPCDTKTQKGLWERELRVTTVLHVYLVS